MSLPVIYFTDQHEVVLPAAHKFPMRKYRMIRELLAAENLFHFEPAPFAPAEIIERVHDPAYVQAFLRNELPPNVMRRIGFPWSPGLVDRTLASVGGTLVAAEYAIANRFSGTLAGGTHHAFRAEGSGFCVFNDIAVVIIRLREKYGLVRAAVIDLDVHQGDGTARIFEDDPHVLTLSLHGKHNFPFRKQRSKIDIELDDKTGDDEYLARLDEALPRVFDFQPQVIFFQSGVDALATDTLGRLSLTPEGMRQRDHVVIGAVHRYGVPFVVTLGGGYSNPIERSVEAHANTFRELHSWYGPAS